MNTTKKFSITLFGDLDFEGMIVEVCFDNQVIATCNYEKGIDNIEIQILPQNQEFIFPLQDFLKVLEKAKKLVIQCAEEDKLREKEFSQ
ncbi:MAG TPA: hypothetical protein VGZ69_05070 [Candidatus Rhabdochlamydia sp.]|jgi:hypothetical protein|nr:hypothetical protein [Candidatus Rhabdochlamydia sp.]